MLGNMMMATFNMQPVANEVHTRVRAGEEMWCKRYGSVTDATTEAVELGIIEARNRPFVEDVLQGIWPAGLPEPGTPGNEILVQSIEPVEVDLDELRARSFLPGF
jgi:hypothetical protein